MSFATRQRFLLGLAVLLMLAPTFMYAAGKLGQAPMFAGDTRKEMTCLTCDGLGTAKGESCKTCYGRGVGDYIIPGPNRPIQLIATLQDGRSLPLVGADIAITEKGSDAQPVMMKTNDDGKFGFRFPPGRYQLKLTHGKLSGDEEIEVKANLDPISASGSETLHKIEETFTLK